MICGAKDSWLRLVVNRSAGTSGRGRRTSLPRHLSTIPARQLAARGTAVGVGLEVDMGRVAVGVPKRPVLCEL